MEARIGRYLSVEEHAHPFGNATWDEMGIRREDIAQLVQCPMLTYGAPNRHSGAEGPQAPAPAGTPPRRSPRKRA